MNSSKRSSAEGLKAIVDTNIIFSAIISPDGNENRLFDLADQGKLNIIICDYVLDEAKAILERKGINPETLTNFLDTYNNIHIEDIGHLENEEIKRAIDNVTDHKDRPIFIFAYRFIKNDEQVFLISGDKDLRTPKVVKKLNGQSLSTREFLTIHIGGL